MSKYKTRKQLQEEVEQLELNLMHKEILCNSKEEKANYEFKKIHRRNNIQDLVKLVIVIAMIIGYLLGEISIGDLLKNTLHFFSM